MTKPDQLLRGRESICTLFEGDYHLGLAAFVNSLVGAGYSGTIWAGYRGSLPPWLSQLTRIDGPDERYRIAGLIDLVFIPIRTELHLANYKPQFMLDLLGGRARECDYLWYFDPDICLLRRWSTFLRWQRYGMALCEEIVNYGLSENDPLRLHWVEIGTEMGLGAPRPLNRYFNSGMVGVSQAHASVLHLWKRILEHFGAMGGDLKGFMPGNRELPFHSVDQDALNMAIMYVEHPLSTMGPGAMGLDSSEFCMYHTVGFKPWRGSILLRALAGIPPSNGIKFFFTQVSSPVRAYSPFTLFAKRSACLLAALIGRFYRRR